jgi:pyruvate/2-oxoglutarate/acetoin dehydrogenase E1 component
MGFSGLAVGAALAGLRPMYVFGAYRSVLSPSTNDICPQMRIHDVQLRYASY